MWLFISQLISLCFLNGFFYIYRIDIYYICIHFEIISVYIQNAQYYIDITPGLYYYKSTRQLELGCFVAKTVKFQNYL